MKNGGEGSKAKVLRVLCVLRAMKMKMKGESEGEGNTSTA